MDEEEKAVGLLHPSFDDLVEAVEHRICLSRLVGAMALFWAGEQVLWKDVVSVPWSSVLASRCPLAGPSLLFALTCCSLAVVSPLSPD